MISPSSKWHYSRQEEMLKKHPELLGIKTHNPYALISIFLVPIVQLVLAYYSQYLPIWAICILAWFVGGFVSFAMFNNAHELCHDVVHPKIKGKLYEILMHISTLPAVNSQYYTLFRWGHVRSHHSMLGGTTVSEALDFLNSDNPDIELWPDQYYFELYFNPREEEPRTFLPFVYKNRYLRMLFLGLIYPALGALLGTFITPLYILYANVKSLFVKQKKGYVEKARSIGIQLLLAYAVLIVLYVFAGPLSLLYLLLSDICGKGFFFHPGVLFALSTHKTWDDEQGVQPTSSTYGKLISLILMKINYHVEHHDFPNIPRAYLPKIRAGAPDFYDSLHSFKGGFDVFRQYFLTSHWLYAGQGKESKISEEASL